MESEKRRSRSSKQKLSDENLQSKFESYKVDQNSHIAILAYYKAQARGFEPGHELEDWLLAEAEVSQ